MKPFSRAEVDAEVFLRAVAISLVTFNHSHNLGFTVGGGMTFLMALSGYNFARFSLVRQHAAEVRQALLKLSRQVAIPTLLVILGSFLVLQQVQWTELFFISSWFGSEAVALIWLWYPQVLIQILLGLWLLFKWPWFIETFQRNPLRTSLVMFGVAVAVRATFPAPALWNHLPHLFLWNFLLGWVIYFVLKAPISDSAWGAKLFVLACTALGGFVGWSGWGPVMEPWFLMFAMTVLLFVRKIPLPAIAARCIQVVSRATFGVFLLHLAFVKLYDQFLPQHSFLKWAFAMSLSVGCWVVMVSMRRAFLHLWREPPMNEPTPRQNWSPAPAAGRGA